MPTKEYNNAIREGDFLPRGVTFLFVALVTILSLFVFEHSIGAVVLTGLLGIACYFDLRYFKIPNRLTYTSVVIALSFNGVATILWSSGTGVESGGLASIGFVPSLFGLLTGLGIMLFVFALAGRGAGDVKLASAIGAMVGPVNVLSIIFVAHILAGLFACAWIVCRVGALTTLQVFCRSVGCTVLPGRVASPSNDMRQVLQQPIPMAGFFALGSILVLGGFLR